ncbi:MAG: hypothetical protein DHS20C17_00010 [Cyclobacteriaceae bacterium]|nr:MAG: hypothetical protein DHS20C17_00010 [Cyclobacteriaceae bacterium]
MIDKSLIANLFGCTFFAFTVACSSGDDPGPAGNTGGTGSGNTIWSIPTDKIFDGGPGKDGIPALLNPPMITPAEATYLTGNDLVIGYKVGDDIRAYPHKILDWHEIINDDIGGQPLAVTYCPLTGTAVGWDRNIQGNVTTFGVSGLLYNTNLIPYDRFTDSNWSQMRLVAINGQLLGERITTFQVVETTWDTWQEMYPDTRVVSTATGIERPYETFPYINSQGQDYRIDPYLIFPIDVDDNRLPRKQRVHGIIINGEAKVYPIEVFQNEVTVISDSFLERDLVIVGDAERNFANSFIVVQSEFNTLEFSAVQNALPVVMEDNEGNQWNIFGEAVSGPRMGQKLPPATSFIGYWFSWGAFYPTAEIYQP